MTAAAVNIGQRIFDLRVERDIQQGELAQAIHMNQSVLNRIEKGTRPARDSEIYTIALFFQVSADYLLGLAKAPTAAKNIPPVAIPSDPANDILSTEYNMLKKYRALDERGKKAVKETIDREYQYIAPANEKKALAN